MSFALKSAACALFVGLTLSPAAAKVNHDGIWTVKTSAEDGSCKTNYDLKVSVKDGKVSYAGMWPVKATGGVNAAGLINMNIAHGNQRVTATGLVRGDTASGDWASPRPDCSGSWIAKKA